MSSGLPSRRRPSAVPREWNNGSLTSAQPNVVIYGFLMKLELLGTTGYHPSEQRHTACFMLPELGVVFDAGTAMFRVREHLVTSTLDIFLTHAHLDHVIGLTFLFDILHGLEMGHVRVYGEPSKLKAVQQHLFAKELFPVVPPLEWCDLPLEMKLADGAVLTHHPLEHPGGAVGYRVDWPDRSLAYITDTTAVPNAPYIEFVRGVDLLVHECYFPDDWHELAVKTGHSWTTPVAENAKAAGVGKLLLAHVNPFGNMDDPVGLDVAKAVFPATELARDGMTVEF